MKGLLSGTLQALDNQNDIDFLDNGGSENKNELYDIAVDIVLDILDTLIRESLNDFGDKALILFLSIIV